MMIEVALNKALFIQFVNFVLLVFILNALLYRPIRQAIKQREEKINQDREEANRLAKEAEMRLNEWNKGLEEAKKAGLEKQGELMKGAKDEERAIITKVREETEDFIKKMRAEMAKDMEAARETLKTQAEAFSLEIAEKILGRPIK
ncbi:MAG: ATP synthase F0 subunit B [Deltaproteobacteria bacterium]|nr:ATP synthase F0 subunit B [Deltaproteobacteria bacterium]